MIFLKEGQRHSENTLTKVEIFFLRTIGQSQPNLAQRIINIG